MHSKNDSMDRNEMFNVLIGIDNNVITSIHCMLSIMQQHPSTPKFTLVSALFEFYSWLFWIYVNEYVLT